MLQNLVDGDAIVGIRLQNRGKQIGSWAAWKPAPAGRAEGRAARRTSLTVSAGGTRETGQRPALLTGSADLFTGFSELVLCELGRPLQQVTAVCHTHRV
jgi:hypothetical protein